jgi:hypothetical protein
MSREFRVVDCRTNVIDPAEIVLVADTAEHAARLAIGEDLVRGGGSDRKAKILRARVYSGSGPTLTMVRLYAKRPD